MEIKLSGLNSDPVTAKMWLLISTVLMTFLIF